MNKQPLDKQVGQSTNTAKDSAVHTSTQADVDRILEESQLPHIRRGPDGRHIIGKNYQEKSESQEDTELRKRLKGTLRMDALDFLTIVSIPTVITVTIVALILNWPQWVLALCVFLLAPIAFALAISHAKKRPDQLRAQESDRITRTANEALPYMGEGLTPDNAQTVCEIVLSSSSSAVAVAMTDEEYVLAFAGRGADHHTPGRPIATEATHTALSRNETVVLSSKVAIGCKDPRCPLRAAIVVPLEVGSRVVGTLKYYYIREGALTETELASAEGLARLLSTQLIIHELEQQATLATELELKALQAQINPHFLFNTINTISAYIRTDAEKARHLLRQFAGFYRRTLEHGDHPITLGLELEFLKQYFELEKARFGDQVNLGLDIDVAALDLPMPSFMLQPLVENSIEHGMRDDGSPLRVEVLVEYIQGSDTWLVTVSDDGVGIDEDSLAAIFEKSSSAGLGVALRNVSDRLRGFYGLDSELVIESTKGVGTEISFLIRDPE
ncbi:MAG: histidine kinase [Coriobacteriia bacterium]|nr:histidine kinase [Coriobacteriia bacterium]